MAGIKIPTSIPLYLTTAQNVKVYNGTNWENTTIKTFNGTAWEQKQIKVYNGTDWQTIYINN